MTDNDLQVTAAVSPAKNSLARSLESIADDLASTGVELSYSMGAIPAMTGRAFELFALADAVRRIASDIDR